MRFLLSGGGTGGHVYPALAVARELLDLTPGSRIVYAGRAGEIEERLSQAHGLQFQPIEAAPLRGSSPLGALSNAWRLLPGIQFRSLTTICELRNRLMPAAPWRRPSSPLGGRSP